MSDATAIEWTDATWNPTRGCDKISPGCKNCYAEKFAERFRGVAGHAYEQGFDLRLAPTALDRPLHWKKPRRIFVNSMSDLFHKDVPAAYIFDVFNIMERCPQHTFQVLTKRAERMRGVIGGTSGAGLSAPPLPNVWLGVSVENQAAADERIPLLLETPAAVRFLSVEPLLGHVDLRRHIGPFDDGAGFIDWVIVGGESGPGARPCDVSWIRSVVEQCKAAGVPCFVKQLGASPMTDLGVKFPGEVAIDIVIGKARQILADRKGGDPDEWPADLCVREFPGVRR